MSYSHTTWTQLQTALSARLGDTSQRFWTSTEIPLYLKEALRTFGLASGFWREREALATSASTVFYDINTLVTILAPTVTDREIIQQVQFALLESASSQTSWTGTEMFSYSDMASAVENRLNQFLSDTGIVVTRSVVTASTGGGGGGGGGTSPIVTVGFLFSTPLIVTAGFGASSTTPVSRVDLSDTIIDVRRAAWVSAAPEGYYSILWRDDERMMTAADASWSSATGTPNTYSIMATPPLEIQVAPASATSGQIELLAVISKDLDPANTATVLGIPDDLTPAIKWGALADLLGKDGIAADPVRADFCEKRYKQYVSLARLLPVVLHAELDDAALIPSTLAEMDSSNPNWENIAASVSAPVQDLILASPNLIAVSAVPSSAGTVTLDVVRKAPIPASGSDYVQIGREQLDMILDYAEHLAMFKCAGAEWHATERQAENFLLQAITYNQRISAAVRAAASAALQSERQKTEIPRRLEAWMNRTFGVGAVTVGDV